MGGRIIALDLGTVRSGLAVSDPTQSIAQPLAVLSSTDTEAFISEIAQYVADYDAERVIVGIPRTMDGRMGEMARWAEGIRRQCERRLSVPVEGRDERLSTVSAQRVMRESDGKRGRRYSDREDSVAAAVVLQAYLDERRLRQDRNSRGNSEA